MSINLDENIVGVWHVEFQEHEKGNWIASISREDGQYRARCRFRYYTDDNRSPLNKDVKNWYSTRAADKDVLLAQVQEMYQTLLDEGSYGWELLRGDLSFDAFMEKFRNQRGMNFTAVQ